MKRKPEGKKRNYNCRSDEADNPFGYQIAFRADKSTSAKFASCCGLIKKYGPKNYTMIKLFREVIVPAVQNYCAPLADAARAERQMATK